MSYELAPLAYWGILLLVPICVLAFLFTFDVLGDAIVGNVGKSTVIPAVLITTAIFLFSAIYTIFVMRSVTDIRTQYDYTATTLSYVTPKVIKEEPKIEEVNKIKSRILIEEYYE